MQNLGTLGSRLFHAAQESNSSIAALITTQKHTIEHEQKVSPPKTTGDAPQGKRSGKKHPHRKKEPPSQPPTPSDSPPTSN